MCLATALPDRWYLAATAGPGPGPAPIRHYLPVTDDPSYLDPLITTAIDHRDGFHVRYCASGVRPSPSDSVLIVTDGRHA